MTRTGGAFIYQLGLSLRLHFRNKMALIYSYIFPTIFLIVFWVLYRHEAPPLARHIGELLTVTALGGACFGLPTSLVSERERGVWRRFRLTPASTLRLVATTAIARYLLLLLAALLQLGLAMTIFGMPGPQHPLDLLVAFSLVAFAFIGLGLVIATIADNVPAVQALGQCIFLPMLVIGGIAVRIDTLPAWAQKLSAYFPGRYAVAALQVSATGDGLRTTPFPVLALLLIGAAGSFVGIKLFRWDQQQRFARLEGKGWVGAALAAWVFVGVLAQATGQVTIGVPPGAQRETLLTILDPGALPEERAAAGDNSASSQPGVSTPLGDTPGAGQPPFPADTALSRGATGVVGATSPGGARPAPVPAGPPPALPPGAAPQPWQSIDRALMTMVDYASLPSDRDIVAPVAPLSEEIGPETMEQLQCLRSQFPQWESARTADPVQRTRNYLYVAAFIDVAQMAEIERLAPNVVYGYLESTIAKDDLEKILYWIASHPEDGDDPLSISFPDGCFDPPTPGNPYTLRARAQIYGLKLLGRMLGAISRG